MSEVDISDSLPNGDDPAFTEEEDPQQTASDHPGTDSGAGSVAPSVVTNNGTIPADQVFVATSQGILSAEQLQEAGIKTTHIVIHDQTLSVADESELKPPLNTPPTPLDKDIKGFKYQWDESVHCMILPVRCKNTNGELYKNKFGSGGRGKCIKSSEQWFTPNEFETFCGRASSKDWKRSIRYGGRTLQCLIEDGILRAHATSCTCAACCDDESVTGPVRLFVPYKRRKRDNENGSPTMKKRPGEPKSTIVPSGMSKEVVVTLPSGPALSRPISVNNAENGETVHIVTTDPQGNFVTGDAVVMTSLTNALKAPMPNVLSMDVSEQKYWWQLEEMANSLVQQTQQLKSMIEQAKQQSLIAKENALQQLKLQMEKEKQDALQAARIENQINLSRAVLECQAQKDIAVQSALAQARAEMQDKIDSVTLVAGDKVTYAVTWTHQNSQGNMDSIIDDVEELEKEKD
ncbi:deformed epidermal autoregulatory factor 1 homolog isoform X1 [Octopus vulgaris]|uniref:Deformed epidermal autoregulatory factor 1 homolog isoform X1 n=1 Tax=Octopus vulgaris TaxID=6645 RepID=A0AA36AM83_OCTVU|nr:deformed epidermal autoregulatory factor 1 homolog isoform X1 [Octopus vulgaris]